MSDETGEEIVQAKNGKRYRVTFAPDIPVDSDDLSLPEGPGFSPETVTFDYETNEAIPMTIFYRSEQSQGHYAKQRPTLHQLRYQGGEVREYIQLMLSLLVCLRLLQPLFLRLL